METGARRLAQSTRSACTRLREEGCLVDVKFSGLRLFCSVAYLGPNPERPRRRSLCLDQKHGRQNGREKEDDEIE